MNQTNYELESKLPLEEIIRRFPIRDNMINRESRIKKYKEGGEYNSKMPNRLYESNNDYQSTYFQSQTNTMLKSNFHKSNISTQKDFLKQSQFKNNDSFPNHQQRDQRNPFIITNQYNLNETDRDMNDQNDLIYKPHQQSNSFTLNHKKNNSYHQKQQSPIRISPTLSLRLSPERKFHTITNPIAERDHSYNAFESKTYFQKGSCDYEERNKRTINEQFISFLKAIIEIENEIEHSKIDLAYQSDFNIDDAYNIFESYNKDMLTEMDIKTGLNKLLLYPTNEEMRLLILKYDLSNNKGGIDFLDFFDMLVPFNKRYRDIVEQRDPRSMSSSPINAFSLMTTNYLVAVFRLLMSSEARLNALRKQLYYQKGFDIKTLFTQLDQFNYGHITSNDLEDYLKYYNICFDNQDIVLLYIRLDKNRDGKVEYDELEALLIPQI